VLVDAAARSLKLPKKLRQLFEIPSLYASDMLRTLETSQTHQCTSGFFCSRKPLFSVDAATLQSAFSTDVLI
jgi:hypothetical protein